jgi:hypothetical protein
VVPPPDPDRDPWAGQRPLSQEIRTPLPRETLALAATAPPLVPGPLRRCDESQETPQVATHAAGVAVASQTSTERGVLGRNRLLPRASTPVVDGLLGPSQARPPRLAPPPPGTFPGTCPIQRAPQKVKGGWTLATRLRLWRRPEGPQPRCGRVEGQAEAPQPLAQDRHHAPCLVLALATAEEVIPIAAQRRLPLKPWLHRGITPPVEPLVSVDVPQQG